MKAYKKYRLSLLCLVLAFVFSLCGAFGLFLSDLFASASGTVTVSTSNIFTGSGEADVIAYKLAGETEDDDEYYTMFTFGDDTGSISYRKNLAYHWYEADDEDEDGLTGAERFYSMEIGLVGLEFEKFVIKYDSSEYNLTKDGKTTNYIIFYPCAEDGDKVYVTVTDDEETELDTSFTTISAARITIAFIGKYSGSAEKAGGYSVKIGYGDVWYEGEFENVGGNYVKNSTSSTKPVAPMTFYCTFAEDAATEREAAKMALFSLNGQSFLLSGVSYSESGEYYYGGTVTDDCPPVLCLDNDFRFVELGGEIDIDYVVIDVLRSSPRATLSYGVLTCDSEGAVSYALAELSTSDEILIESDVDKYYPVSSDYVDENTYDDEDLVADMAIKIKLTLTDITSNGESCDIYLDWYIAEEYLLEISDGTDTERYVAVATDNLGATYNYGGITIDGTAKSWGQIKADYQAAVDEAAENLSAGSSSYIYLPSCEELFSDNATSYTDLTLGIYYYNSSQSSNGGLTSSNLSINLTEQGSYTFTIYATDAAGNTMWYFERDDVALDSDGNLTGEIKEEDGSPKRVEFSTGEIWTMYEDEDEEGLANYIPWFTFSVGYTGAEFDEVPGKQSTAYVGTSYTASSFSINGISGAYSVSYRLFLFDREGYYNLTGVTLSYDDYVEALDELWDNYRTLFAEIPALADLEEDDEDYEDYCDYAWSSSSVSFVPQDDNAFYLIRAELTDTYYSSVTACNMGIVASVAATELKGESEWLKNNIASIVLLSVAGASLIGIVVLLVIKPKDKTDIDVKLEGSKKKKSKKNKAE